MKSLKITAMAALLMGLAGTSNAEQGLDAESYAKAIQAFGVSTVSAQEAAKTASEDIANQDRVESVDEDLYNQIVFSPDDPYGVD